MTPFRVLLVDESVLVLELLKQRLARYADIRIVGSARNGQEALAMIPSLKPNLICTDLVLPKVDGFTLIREVMRSHPTPILVVTNRDATTDEGKVFQALADGAVDVFPKQSLTVASDSAWDELVRTMKIAARVRVVRRIASQSTQELPRRSDMKDPATPLATAENGEKLAIVAIGASTGGPQALERLLSLLPDNFPFPILCVQHIAPGFLGDFIRWLRHRCALKVKEAVAGESPLPGTIYFAPESTHLELTGDRVFALSNGPPVDGHRPSITVTFESVAQVSGRSAIAVLLTGMGRDGALGMLAVARAGGRTIAQDEESSAVFGMPKAAIDLSAARCVLPLDKIAQKLKEIAWDRG